MTNYFIHKTALLKQTLLITELEQEYRTWKEINDTKLCKHYGDLLKREYYKQEIYLNNLLCNLSKMILTKDNIQEVKLCYELLEQYSKTHYSFLFKKHLNYTIETYQKKYGDFIIKGQFSKANETEKLIHILELQF